MKSFADPLAQAEINRLRAKLARVEALAEGWIKNGSRDRDTRWGQLRVCGQILRDVVAGVSPASLAIADREDQP